MAVVKTISVKLRKDKDEDIIEWLENQDNRTLSIKSIIRDVIKKNGITKDYVVMLQEK